MNRCLLSCDPTNNAVTKCSVSVTANLCCADSVCMCCKDFVSGSHNKILKCQRMFISKIIICLLVNTFCYSLSLFVIGSFRDMGVEEGQHLPGFWNWTFSHHIFAKKVVFLVSSGGNVILPLLAPCKNIFDPLLENPLMALPWKKNPSPAPMFRGTCSCIKILKGYMARESLGSPDLNGMNHSNWLRKVSSGSNGYWSFEG